MFKPDQWYEKTTFYQVLTVEPHHGQNKQKDNKNPRKILKTTLNLKSREAFSKWELDQATTDKLKGFPSSPSIKDKHGNNFDPVGTIAAYLPSPGICLKEDFLKKLSPSTVVSVFSNQTVNSNISYPIGILLRGRKMSQLIAKTWDAYYQAKTKEITKNGQTKKIWWYFCEGDWGEITKLPDGDDILDGLIAREIFLTSDCAEPDKHDPEELVGYYPLKEDKSKVQDPAKFVISPASQAWGSIELSLLLAGQVYRKVGSKVASNDNQKYHQISQPILSTGEIVTMYNLEVSRNIFAGEMQELHVDWDKPSGIYKLVIPYPPIPSELNLSLKEIQDWANAEDDNGKFPFYLKDSTGQYLVGTKFNTPPYPYIPLSCL